jgi:hypothetical protein
MGSLLLHDGPPQRDIFPLVSLSWDGPHQRLLLTNPLCEIQSNCKSMPGTKLFNFGQ